MVIRFLTCHGFPPIYSRKRGFLFYFSAIYYPERRRKTLLLCREREKRGCPIQQFPSFLFPSDEEGRKKDPKQVEDHGRQRASFKKKKKGIFLFISFLKRKNTIFEKEKNYAVVPLSFWAARPSYDPWRVARLVPSRLPASRRA